MILKKTPTTHLGYDFIPADFIPKGQNEYYWRNKQCVTHKAYRQLKLSEIDVLLTNGNTSDEWNNLFVTDKFNPRFIRNCSFYGLVRIGDQEDSFLEFHDLRLPIGLYNSTIISSDLGDNVVINNVHYLSHYIIGSQSILFNINEIQTSNKAKFGNGIVKEGEDESVRIWMEISNESGGRKIAPFDGILTSDAWLWSKFRDDEELMQRFVTLTDTAATKERGYYGTIGQNCVIKNCQIIKDVKIGDAAYIKGGNKLKNLTINSSFESPTQIGEGTELVNGIIGFGCKLFYGVKAVRFALGNNSSLKYGARLINAMLGENSTISCCEVLNSLLFPGHEQHHNNSFLIAATILGQSNMAAGATIGSNHNSRANDGEIIAGRGFWPGLCVSLKHNSKFASFNLLVKGNYPYEINNPFPFALLANNEHKNQLEVLPAYWWLYNMYALARNTWKYKNRDKRIFKAQEFEFDYLAPDSVNEIIKAVQLLEYGVGKALVLEQHGKETAYSHPELCEQGKDLLLNNPQQAELLKIFAEGIEAGNRKVLIIKPVQAYQAYLEMLKLYGVKTLVTYLTDNTDSTITTINALFKGATGSQWINIGGQLITAEQLTALKTKIKTKNINTWEEVHAEYRNMHTVYAYQKAKHAYSILLHLLQPDPTVGITHENWKELVSESLLIADKINKRIYESRRKDYTHPFKKMMYDTDKEMECVIGTLEDNDFIKASVADYQAYATTINRLL